jgi:hypothetical protein
MHTRVPKSLRSGISDLTLTEQHFNEHTITLPFRHNPTKNMSSDAVEDLSRHLVHCSMRNGFGLTPHPWQEVIGSHLNKMLCPASNIAPGPVLLCQPTGVGKSLVRDTFAVAHGGITWCISPLLSHAADQLTKLQQQAAVSSIVAIHLFAQFGLYFRDEFLQLHPLVFDNLRVGSKPPSNSYRSKLPSIVSSSSYELPATLNLNSMHIGTRTPASMETRLYVSSLAFQRQLRYVGSIRTLELPGLILSDIWDPELVKPTIPPLPVTECFPIMIASSGYSCMLKNHAGTMLILSFLGNTIPGDDKGVE